MEKREVGELQDIEVEEVSLVGHPANMRKFLLIKKEEGQMGEEEVVEAEKALSDHDHNAIQGALKILGKISAVKDIVKLLEKFTGGKTQKEENLEDEKKFEEEVTKRVEVEKERDNEKERADKAEVAIAELKKSDRKRELAEIAKSLDGDEEKNTAYLERLAEHLPDETFKEVVEREKTHKTITDASKLLEEKGTNKSDDSPSEEKLLEMVNERVKKGEKRMDVINEGMHDNEDLYEMARKEGNRPVASVATES